MWNEEQQMIANAYHFYIFLKDNPAQKGDLIVAS